MTDLETRLREVPRDGGDRGRHAGDRRRGGRGAAAVATTVFTLGGELHPDETSAGISFVDHEGKGHAVNVGVTGKLTVSRNMLPLAQACSLRGGGRCDELPRPDGSTVVLFGSSAVHYRADGTAVDLSDLGRVSSIVASELGLPVDSAPSGPTFDDRQLIALVTDPGFAAQWDTPGAGGVHRFRAGKRAD